MKGLHCLLLRTLLLLLASPSPLSSDFFRSRRFRSRRLSGLNVSVAAAFFRPVSSCWARAKGFAVPLLRAPPYPRRYRGAFDTPKGAPTAPDADDDDDDDDDDDEEEEEDDDDDDDDDGPLDDDDAAAADAAASRCFASFAARSLARSCASAFFFASNSLASRSFRSRSSLRRRVDGWMDRRNEHLSIN